MTGTALTFNAFSFATASLAVASAAFTAVIASVRLLASVMSEAVVYGALPMVKVPFGR